MATPTRGQRLVSSINGSIAAVLVIVLAAVALVVKPPAPPGISEFAPQAAKPISKAPLGQTLGNGGQRCAAGASCTGPAAARASKAAGKPLPRPTGAAQHGVPSSLQCYVWPSGAVTQTFDPQSPPCVADWPDAPKGNGGATSFGVDATTVRVSIGSPLVQGDPETAIAKAFTEFFNRHFELWGRRIVLVSHAVDGAFGDPSSQRAAAAKAKEQHAFAAISTDNATDDSSLFLQSLARNKILGVDGFTSYVRSENLAALAPYAWSYPSPFDVEQRNEAEFLCRALVGHPAAHAGDAVLRTAKRSFAVIVPRPVSGPRADTRPVRDALRACGVTADEIEYVGFPQSSTTSPDATNVQVMADLKRGGVTTVVPVGSTLDIPEALTGASRAAYHPEWFVLPTADYYASGYSLGAPPDEVTSLMGIASWNKSLPHSSSVAFRAFADVDGGKTDEKYFSNQDDTLYKALLLIASGIQAAGPALSPRTFASELDALRFPNPAVGVEPSYQGGVSLSGDQAMMDDFGLWSWRSTEKSYDGAVGNVNGNYCYIGQGRRFRLGDWPSADPGLFDPAASC